MFWKTDVKRKYNELILLLAGQQEPSLSLRSKNEVEMSVSLSRSVLMTYYIKDSWGSLTITWQLGISWDSDYPYNSLTWVLPSETPQREIARIVKEGVDKTMEKNRAHAKSKMDAFRANKKP